MCIINSMSIVRKCVWLFVRRILQASLDMGRPGAWLIWPPRSPSHFLGPIFLQLSVLLPASSALGRCRLTAIFMPMTSKFMSHSRPHLRAPDLCIQLSLDIVTYMSNRHCKLNMSKVELILLCNFISPKPSSAQRIASLCGHWSHDLCNLL